MSVFDKSPGLDVHLVTDKYCVYEILAGLLRFSNLLNIGINNGQNRT